MTKRHIFLSPHLDDVVLSCGGMLAQLTAASVSVITIFAGMPDSAAPISEFAQYQHDMWGNPQQAYHTRRAEDTAALASFNLAPIWLDFFDCIYRTSPQQQRWYYNSDDDIFGALHPAEADTVPSIIAAIQQRLNVAAPISRQGNTIIYSPLTVGRHVDHQLVFLAAIQLLIDGYTVRFYEEFPYVDRDPANLNTALYETTPMLLAKFPQLREALTQRKLPDIWDSKIQRFSKAALARKIAAIAAYRTQLEVLFGSEEAMAQRVTAYSARIGEDGFGERLWQLNL